MKIGYVIPHHEIGTDPQAMKDLVQGAETLGATNLLLYDHVVGADPDRPGGWQGNYDKDIQFHEPLTTLAYIAGVTNTIELMSAVLILPQRQTVLVAKQAAEVAILSGGRFTLGIGTGWNALEYEALGENFNTRGKRQAEQVELMRKLWQEDSVDFTGAYHRVDKASINPRPAQTIPIWFGGASPALLKRCAELGDGWLPLTPPNDASRNSIATLKQHREAAGLSWECFGIQAHVYFQGGNEEKWQRNASRWKELGATHLAFATYNTGIESVDGHLAALKKYMQAIESVVA